jgi:hypothetical protein
MISRVRGGKKKGLFPAARTPKPSHACVLVRFNHVASCIVNANPSIM